MCGIMFKTNYCSKTDHALFKKATDLLEHRGPDEEGFLYTKDYSFGHKRLTIRDIILGKQPMSILNHHLVYNGEIYNFKELNDMLENKVKSNSDTELLLKLMIEFGPKIINSINGIFAFVYAFNDTVIMARDHVGVKPLYYTIYNNDLLASSEIKSLLTYGVKARMGCNELAELIALSPSHSPGNTLYKDIFEVKPGHYMIFKKNTKLEDFEYFNVKRKQNTDSYSDNVSYVRYLLTDSIKRNLISDVGISSFLSGGLDSSIISSVAHDTIGEIDTYSIDYEGNDKEFKQNSFETSRDEDYIGYLVKKKGYNHKTVKIDSQTLFDYLKTDVILRDGPGMADIDSSMLYLAKEVSKKHRVSLSGECADELFGGYPWFKEKNITTFPWIRNIEQRIDLLNERVKNKIDVLAYLNSKYNEIIKEAPVLEEDDENTKKELQMNYINLKYFMPTLLDRKDRMTMGASLEVRVPFADRRIVNFAYNLPYKFKNYNNKEKQILRDAMKEYLPREILERKKSPYPKSQAKSWHKIVKNEILKVLDSDTPLKKIFNIKKLKELCSDDRELEVPWFGQLMRKDAFMAYLYQIHYWLTEYKIEVEI